MEGNGPFTLNDQNQACWWSASLGDRPLRMGYWPVFHSWNPVSAELMNVLFQYQINSPLWCLNLTGRFKSTCQVVLKFMLTRYVDGNISKRIQNSPQLMAHMAVLYTYILHLQFYFRYKFGDAYHNSCGPCRCRYNRYRRYYTETKQKQILQW